ncbi:TetR/AcrR family transcriptional regulator [Mycobacterium sp.]|uniref:TetR/AcrR family transcriptional regulator n=1 Tax=Mycobacterium sp. TaxID=1785 RepID=UPI0025F91827|nr:TetR/AcrR family transcriptional regulator [Mycobacterium sp.]
MGHITGGSIDPRPARSQARLLEAAAALLRSGGPSAVTVDAVTRTANVARATLYRHFPSGNDLLAAAFNSLIPPSPTPPAEGSLRDRLIAVVLDQAEAVAQAPALLTAMSWLALGRDLDGLPEPQDTQAADSAAISTLRERIAQQYAAPFDAIFDSPDAAELGDVDRSRAIALLIGPLVLGRLSTLPDFDYRECALAAVDGFLYVQCQQNAEADLRPTANGAAPGIETAGA